MLDFGVYSGSDVPSGLRGCGFCFSFEMKLGPLPNKINLLPSDRISYHPNPNPNPKSVVCTVHY